ncbi:MAG: hypothetical protein HC927_01645 [Deltaproteobacteria bacterium]|nr:hypothetical protein [Deltaproteobacteria bacterium]
MNKRIKWSLLPLSLLGLGLVGLAAPACVDTPDEEEFERELQPIDMCPKEYFELAASGKGQVICGLVVDSKGAPIEDDKLTIVIDGKPYQGPKVDWVRELEKGQPRDVLIDISAPGYAPLVEVVNSSLLDQPFVLQRLNKSELSPDKGGQIFDPSGASIVIPPNSLERLDGKKPIGTVTVGTFFFNPGLQDLPGDYSAINQKGQLVYLLSQGTFFTGAWDAAGNPLRLRAGFQTQVAMPLDIRQKNAPVSTPLWTFDRGKGVWRQIEGQSKQIKLAVGELPNQELHIQAPGVEPVVYDCEDFSTDDPCYPAHCQYQGNIGMVGDFNSLGFVNFDIEKTDPACIYVDIDESQLNTDQLPICLRFEVPNPIAGGVTVREDCMGPDGTVLYNIPPNVVVDVYEIPTYGCAGGATSRQVNSGAPWGGTGVPNVTDCNGYIQLPPFP